MPAPVRIVVQGPAERPAVTIGGNMYAVDVVLDGGQYLEIDGARKTIRVVHDDGRSENVFSKRVGSQVVGGGEYSFAEVPVGESDVVWNGAFKIAVTVIEQRSEPRWS